MEYNVQYPFPLNFYFFLFINFFCHRVQTVQAIRSRQVQSDFGDAQSQDALCSRLSVHAAGGVVACLTLQHSAIPVLTHFSLFP